MNSRRVMMDLASMRKLRERRESLRAVEPFPYSEEIRSVMVTPVFTSSPEDKLRTVINDMVKKGVSSVVVVDGKGSPLGILTERDVMRMIAVAVSIDLETTPLSAVMTKNPVLLTPADTIYQALSILSSKGIKHLPLIEGGRLAGIITLRQLLKLRYPEPMMLIEAISEAESIEDLRKTKSRLARLAASKLSTGVRAFDVVVMLSLINQDIHRKAFEITIDATGDLPTACCLFLTGSHGRMENLLTTDQDHGFIIADDPSADASADKYWKRLAESYSSNLEKIGFEKCPGEIMAVNPVWRRSLTGWKDQLDHWIIKQVPNMVRYVTVFFDAIPLWGDGDLFQSLNDHAFSLIGKHYEVLRMLHEEEGSHRVPTGLLGRFITERRGEHRGEFDIKRSGLIFVVEGVRILALLRGIRETSTLQRITKLVDSGFINSDDGEYFEGAYRFLLHFALNAQVEKAVEDGEIDTYVNPDELSSREKEMLRHAYRAVTSLQDLIASEFGELVL